MPNPIGLITAAVAANRFQSKDASLTFLSGKSLTGSGEIVLATSPTIVTPTIASLTNMQHNHADAAGGGTIAHSVLTGLTTGDPHTQYVLLTPGGSTRNAIQASGNFIAVAVKASGTGTPNLLEFQNSGGTSLSYFTSLGQLVLKAGADAAIPGGTSAIGTDGSNNLELRSLGAIEMRPLVGGGVRIYDTLLTFTGQTSASVNMNSASVTPLTFTNLSAGGAIKVIVKAGAAQSTNDLLQIQDTSANVMALISSAGGAVINEQGNDADTRIEGDTDANLLFVDASADMIGLKTNAPTAVLDINSDILRLRTAKTPASAAAAGNAGDHCWDATYEYRCIATNTWTRVARATW